MGYLSNFNAAGSGSPTTYGKYTALKNPIAIDRTTGQRIAMPGTAPAAGATASPAAPPVNDYTKQAMDRLSAISSGKDVPLDETTKANMYSKAQEQTAAAEQAQNESLMAGAAAGGASPNDPSLQGAKRQAMAARQGGNQQAMRDIELETRKENFSASQRAAEALAGFGQTQQRIDQADPNNPANVQMLQGNPFAVGGGTSGPSQLGFQFGGQPQQGQTKAGASANQAAQNRLAKPAQPSLSQINIDKRAVNAAANQKARDAAFSKSPIGEFQARMKGM